MYPRTAVEEDLTSPLALLDTALIATYMYPRTAVGEDLSASVNGMVNDSSKANYVSFVSHRSLEKTNFSRATKPFGQVIPGISEVHVLHQ